MTTIRVIPVSPLGHAADCLICAAVDRWAANRKRPATRRAGDPDLAGGFWGATASRDVDRQPAGSPDSPLRASSAVPLTTDGGAPASASAGLSGTADVQRQGASTRSLGTG